MICKDCNSDELICMDEEEENNEKDQEEESSLFGKQYMCGECGSE